METEAIKLRQYLLGSLREEEAEKIDLRIIADQNFEEELLLAEDALIEDFLDERLSSDEVELFYKNFLISKTREEQLKELAALKNYAQNTAAKEISGEPTDSFFDKLKNLFTVNFRSVAVGLGLLIVGMLAIAVWQFGLSGSNAEMALLEKKAVELNSQNLSDLDRFENLSKLSLFSGQLRSSDEIARLSAGGLTERVLLRLALPPEENSNLFNARIIRNQTDSLALNKISAYSNQSGREVRLVLPSEYLKNGEYKIELVPENRNDFPLNYSFAVQ